jgi:hypothetical protein
MSDSEKKLETALNAELAKARNQQGARNILALLFPKAENALRTFIPTDSDINVRKIKRRFSQKDFAESYFALSPQENSWGQSEFELAISGPPLEAFNLLRRKIENSPKERQSDIRRIFLELLDSKFSSTQQLDENWLNALIAESPELLSKKDQDTRSFFSIDNEDRLRWIVVHGLKELPSAEQINLLKSAISTAKDLTVLTDVVRGIFGDSNPEGSNNHRSGFSFNDEESAAIRKMLVSRIKEIAEAGDIWSQARPDRILWFWWGTDAEDEVKAFTNRAMASAVGLRTLLDVSVRTVRSTSGDYESVSPSWEKIVDINALSERATELINTANNENDVRLAHRFLEAMEKGRKDTI